MLLVAIKKGDLTEMKSLWVAGYKKELTIN